MNTLLIILIHLFSLLINFSSYAQNNFEIYLEKTKANVIFVRHALAPGYGDPINFDIDDCKTQRNLNEKGRRQAENLGKYFKNSNIKFNEILTSEWCRCVETAKYLNLGKWKKFSGLNSFFEGHSNKNNVLTKLKTKLRKIGQKDLIIMISHQVVISKITGILTQSGGIVFYNTINGKSKELIIK